MKLIFESLNPVNVLIFFTFLHLFFCRLLLKKNYILFLILSISLINEVLLIYNKSLIISIDLCISFYIIFNAFFWLCILQKHLTYVKIFKAFVLGYLLFSFYIIFFEEKLKINKYTFVLGSFIYLSFLFFESFYQLKKENLALFDSNQFILLIAPILFFLGFSFMFGFRNKEIRSTYILTEIQLYTFISYYVNIIYYSLINLYIFKEHKLLKNG